MLKPLSFGEKTWNVKVDVDLDGNQGEYCAVAVNLHTVALFSLPPPDAFGHNGEAAESWLWNLITCLEVFRNDASSQDVRFWDQSSRSSAELANKFARIFDFRSSVLV